jgi:phage shock protein C
MTAESTAPAGGPASPEMSRRSATRRLHRSRSNRVFAGVCGGIAEYYGSDPTAVRLATVILGLFTGVVPMVVVYTVAALVIPTEDVAVAGDRAEAPSGQTVLVLGAMLVLVGLAGFVTVWFHVAWEQLWPLALISMGAVILLATIRPRP